MTEFNRFHGALLGLAVGDALGAAVEFKPPGSFEPVTGMRGGGPFGLQPGEWTDDTSMALCLAASLAEKNGFDADDQMRKYVDWWRNGYMSSTGSCFDIGITTSSALRRYEATGEPFSGDTDNHTSGNGSIMRLAPVPLAYSRDPAQALRRAADSSRTTHGAPAAVDACRYMAGILVGALQGRDKDELLSAMFTPAPGAFDEEPLDPAVEDVARGSFKEKEPPAIRGTGYVVQSLEAALWAFHRSSSFEDGCLLAVNLGEDSDTTGAVYGQIAGAYYGADAIPEEWRERIAMPELFEKYAGELLELSSGIG